MQTPPIGVAILVAASLAGACTTHHASGGGDDQGNPIDAAVAADDLTGPPPAADLAPPVFHGSVYAQSFSELYRVDSDTLAVMKVGTFTFNGVVGMDVITDIALDRDSNMVGISYEKLYAIDKDTAKCKLLSTIGLSFNGLTYVPPEEIDPSGGEVLVAANGGGDLYRIEPQTGIPTKIGNYGGGLMSSGDLVSVRGFGTVATVKKTETGNDFLVRVDLLHGGTATIIGDTQDTNIFGLGFWGGKIYGFTQEKRFVTIDVNTGLATLVQTGNVFWWGAGVTTSAPTSTH